MNNEWNINFLENSPFSIQYMHSSEMKHIGNSYFEMVWNCSIIF